LFAHGRPSPVQPSDVAADAGPSGEAPDLPRYSYDASLLFRRMAALQVDRDELVSDDPLLFRELQALCTLCRSKERCVLRARESRVARVLPQCHDAECPRRGAKLRSGGAIPAEAAFHRLLGEQVIGSG
jgi:hypothetical protein